MIEASFSACPANTTLPPRCAAELHHPWRAATLVALSTELLRVVRRDSQRTLWRYGEDNGVAFL
jgi:hypothetical protein